MLSAGGALGGTVGGLENTAGNLGIDVPLDDATNDVTGPLDNALGKLLDEQMAAQFCRWDPDLKIIGLRFSNVMAPADYAVFPTFDADATQRSCWRSTPGLGTRSSTRR